MEQNNNLPAFNPQEFSQIISTAPAVLNQNESALQRCNAAGQTLIDTIEANNGKITDDALDMQVAEYINKVKKQLSLFNERRKPFTQLLNSLTKRFTSIENSIDPKNADSIAARLQKKRDEYAAEKIAAQRKREEELRHQQAVANEKASYRADLNSLLESSFSKYLETAIGKINGIFTAVTLDNYNTSLQQLKDIKLPFNWQEFCQTVKDNIRTAYIDDDTRKDIKRDVAQEKFGDFTQRYTNKINELRQDLIDRMPSKRKALEEERALAEKNAEAARLAEAERKAKEEAEARLAEEKRAREKAEAEARAEAEKKVAEANAAFEAMKETAEAATPIKAKVKKKIEIVASQGFLEVYQLWFMKEGKYLSIDELAKVHKKMITFCEKEANRDNGELINSAFIRYVDDVKAK